MTQVIETVANLVKEANVEALEKILKPYDSENRVALLDEAIKLNTLREEWVANAKN
jgi:glutamate formiminotransferase